MTLPVVALVGRPNVGKSTLFNRLVGARHAIVDDVPGTTRDRLYGTVEWRDRRFILVDTGGIGIEPEDEIAAGVLQQARTAIAEADAVVFVVDSRAGPLPTDREIADLLRRSGKPIVLAANKADTPGWAEASTAFYELGLGDPLPISAHQGMGTGDLLDAILDVLPPGPAEEVPTEAVGIAIVGRPNVGKSSLLNAILGRERVVVSEVPGTTRDAVDTFVEYQGQPLLLIDTAGIRRRGRIGVGVERWSVLRAMRAIDRAEVVLLLVDATEGVTAQDTHIAGYAHEEAKGLVVVVNKWDLVPKPQRDVEAYRAAVRQALNFADYAPVVFTSAKTGQGVSKVVETALRIAQEREKRVSTAQLNRVLDEAVFRHPLSERGHRLKLYYTTQAGVRPPTFVLFVNDSSMVHFSYVRYLENQIRQHFGFEGTGIKLVFRGHKEKENARARRGG
ncbi:MAG TPA: ribosome biogenesis GTPase Der [Chloroflexota bacterium]